ncbi:restriction endonuclease subunit S [Pseudoflavonifractor sp. 524-17]|uniref:restriction endonuclease subunit S n=1 Tax=Pseudoflavonifractor sp. 524-17 TaxID=2304577 RepID=UPI00137989E9|nr:restriction endonuclease subunit S [Pseudoflavonifractor sp. 524-17]NCE66252.1 restriction endonuclease subunit S [Pseudoflavonifractor sp. 524-17]
MNLGTVAAIRSGLVLSRKLSREISSYRYPLLNLRAIHPDGYILPDSLEVFYATELLRQEYLTQQGDIIIRLSIPYTAILIDTDMTGMVVSSNFAIIRLNQKYMLPEYLLWLLNTPDIKRKIYENSSSNMLSAVRPTFFAELEVLLLPLADQEKIAKLNLLAKQEIQLLKKLADEKERYYVAVIEHAQKNMRRKIHDDQKRY